MPISSAISIRFNKNTVVGNRGSSSEQPPFPVGRGVIKGSGFGVKPNDDVYFDDMESHSVGAVVGTLGRLNLSGSGGTSISTAQKSSGTRSYRHDYSLDRFPKVYLDFEIPVESAYQSCKLYFTGTISSEISAVWKFGRFGAGEVYSGVPHVAESYTSDVNAGAPETFSGEIVTSNGITSSSMDNTAEGIPEDVYLPNQWLFVESELYAGTVDNDDAQWQVKVNGTPVVLMTGRQYRTAAASNLIEWLITPVDGLDDATTINIIVYMDEFFSTGSRYRVIMSSSADPSATGTGIKRAAQVDTQWSDSEITYTAFNGSFMSGDTAYLHVYNNGQWVWTTPSFLVE